ncbi:uncharacterized protein LOC136063911 [Quercus suber]|uniref:uncharacterized protein LOC136063911 n=1 Tax=Quercus suber TaxID=58331 RepID=UPI0032DFAF60
MGYKDYKIKDELLWHKGRLVLPSSSQYKETIIREFHDTPVGGHSGILRTFKRLAANSLLVGDEEGCAEFCSTMTTDFLRFSDHGGRRSPFQIWPLVAVKHPYSAKTIAELFVKEIARLHGMPRSIVSDRDPYLPVETTLCERDDLLRLLKENLQTAQNRMKINADRHRREVIFEPGDFVFLRLQPFRQLSIRTRGNMKLSPRFYGPYKVLERVGKVAYRLDLPSHSRLHPVVHVSQLKKQLGQADRAISDLPNVDDEGLITLEPDRIVDFRWTRRGRQVLQEALVHWTGVSEDDATWEPYKELQQRFSQLNLEDKIRLQGEGNVMSEEKGALLALAVDG